MDDMKDDDKNGFEQSLSELLESGEMERENPDDAARRRVSPRYEIRVQTAYEPVVEETKLYRNMAQEVDDRYDKRVEGRDRDKENGPRPD